MSSQHLDRLNEYLSDHSYLCGHIPTKLDNDVHTLLERIDEKIFDKKYIYICRWFNHIGWFPGDERKKFPCVESKLPKAVECLFRSKTIDEQVRD